MAIMSAAASPIEEGNSSTPTKYLLMDIENAHLKKNFQPLGMGKMDPFVTLSTKPQHAITNPKGGMQEITRTPTHWDSHFEPVWFHECPRIPMKSSDDTTQLVFVVWNDTSMLGGAKKEMSRSVISMEELLHQVKQRKKSSKSGSLGLAAADSGTDSGCRIMLPLSNDNGTLTLQVKIRDAQHTPSSSGFTPVDPSWFESPVKRLGVSGGTAPFFQLTLTNAGLQATGKRSKGYYIGKDLSHAEDEREFYEKILQIQAAGEEPTGVGLLTPFLFDYLGVLETVTTDSQGRKCQLLVMQNLRDSYETFRMMDLKMGQQTAVGGWQGKSRLRAMKQNLLDGMTNSTLEGYRLEGFDGSPERVESMDPLLDILREAHEPDETSQNKTTMWGRKVSPKEAKKAKRIMLQTLHGADIFRYLGDLHLEQKQQPLDDISAQYSAVEVAEIVMHELVSQLVRLAVTCHRLKVPQKWIGSSVALGFDSGLYPQRTAEAEGVIRSKVVTNVFDWGRSELLTQRRYQTMTEADQIDRQRFWSNYKDGMDRLAYNATREYFHRFTNSTTWTSLTISVMDFDSMTADDYMGKVTIPLPDPTDVLAVQALQAPRPLALRAGDDDTGKCCGVVYVALSWLDCPAESSRLRGMWRVTIMYAKDLPVMDVNTGASDPYCIVTARDAKNHRELSQMTCVKARTLNPQWNETLDIPVVKPQHADNLRMALAAEGVVLDNSSPSTDVMDQELGRLFKFAPPQADVVASNPELVQEWTAYLRKAAQGLS